MTKTEKYDKLFTGIIAGFILPFTIGLVVYFFSPGNRSLITYLGRIVEANIITHAITLCVFPTVFLFLIFNRLDMLRASRGVLGITIVWAVIVFAVKLFR